MNPADSDSGLDSDSDLGPSTPWDHWAEELCWEYETLADQDGPSPDREAFLKDRLEKIAASFRTIAPLPEIAAAVGSTGSDDPEWIDHFRVLKRLGRGGQAKVFQVEQISDGHPVRVAALKRFPEPSLFLDHVRQAFEAEIKAFSTLRHPNIPRIELPDSGLKSAQPYFIMDYIQGMRLDDWLDAHAAVLTPRKAVELIEPIADAVVHVHWNGRLHRDIKPSNILVDDNGKPWLIDFGLSALIDEETGTASASQTQGTPLYMAPEQAEPPDDHGPRKLTERTDVYGLGAVLYRALTREPPIQGESRLAHLAASTLSETSGSISAEMRRRIRHETPVAPRLRNPSIDRDLEAICVKCLEKSPEKRYPSAAELKRDLANWRTGRPIVARPPSPPRRLFKWVKRHPAIALLIAALACAPAVAGYWVFFERQQERLLQLVAAKIWSEKDSAQNYLNHYVRRNERPLDARWTLLRRLIQPGGPETREEPSGSGFMSVAQTPDNSVCAAGTQNGRIWLWRRRESSRPDQRIEVGDSLEPRIQGHVRGLAFSRNGRYLAAVGSDRWIRVWDWRASPTQPVCRVPPGSGSGRDHDPAGHFVPLWCVTFSRDGDRELLITSGGSQGIYGQGEAKVWRWEAENRSLTWLSDLGERSGGRAWGAAPLPNGDRIAVGRETSGTAGGGSGNRVEIWDWRAHRLLAELPCEYPPLMVAFSQDGRHLAAGCGRTENYLEGEIRLWSDPSRQWSDPSLAGRVQRLNDDARQAVWAVCFAEIERGVKLASGSADDGGLVKLWDLDDSDSPWLTLRGHQGAVKDLSFADGCLISISEDGTLKRWDIRGRGLLDLESPRLLQTVVMDDCGYVWDLAVSPDGRKLVAVGKDTRTGDGAGVIKRFAVLDNGTLRTIGNQRIPGSGPGSDSKTPAPSIFWGASFVRNGDGGDGGDRYWTSGVDGMVREWDWPRARLIRAVPVGPERGMTWMLDVDCNGADLVCAKDYGVTILRNVGDPASTPAPEFWTQGHHWVVSGSAFSPGPSEPRRIASADFDGALLVRDQSGRPVHPNYPLIAHRNRISAMTWLSDDEIITAGWDRMLKIWNARTATLARERKAHEERINAVAAHRGADPKIATVGKDRAVRVWDAKTLRLRLELWGHQANVLSAVFSPDGKRLFSGGADGSIRVWSVDEN